MATKSEAFGWNLLQEAWVVAVMIWMLPIIFCIAFE